MAKVPINIPNILTIFRLLLIIPTVALLLSGSWYIALVCFIIACITDLLDGAIARKYNQISEAGVLLDPLADKLMIVSVTVAFAILDILPDWVYILIFIKEGLMIIGGFILYIKKLVFPANNFGKVAAFTYNLSLGLVFLHEFVKPWHMVFVCVSLVLMACAFLQYAYLNWYKGYIMKVKRKKDGVK